ncbi:MAG TPA: hypothetical protein PKA58_31180 [Polyangium sp.]|nr:hypothetical protein [Polyangium sp.]
MIPVDQSVFHERGDCMSACIASILELPLEEVPHFAKYDDWRERLDAWLRDRGMYSIEGIFNGDWRPDGLYLLGGKSPRHDGSHCVVARGHEVLHDPHPSRLGVLTQEHFKALVPFDPIEYVKRNR